MKKEISQLRVMLVEDQDRIRHLMRDVLIGFNIRQVIEYNNAETAMRFLARSYDFIDVVLCDWSLEGDMSGLGLLKKVRRSKINVLFLMISGRNDAEAIQLAKENGVDGYILKPFSPEQIEVKLRIALAQEQAA